MARRWCSSHPLAVKPPNAQAESQFDNLKRFESARDSALAELAIFRYDASRVILDSAGAISMMYSEDHALENRQGLLANLERGFDVALQLLIDRSGSQEFAIDQVIQDLLFLSHYFMLRECLYYTYNSPNSFAWQFSRQAVGIEIADTSIPRQFAQYFNSVLLSRINPRLQLPDIGAELMALLDGKEEIGEHQHVAEALMLTEREAALRLSSQFDILGGEKPQEPLAERRTPPARRRRRRLPREHRPARRPRKLHAPSPEVLRSTVHPSRPVRGRGRLGASQEPMDPTRVRITTTQSGWHRPVQRAWTVAPAGE